MIKTLAARIAASNYLFLGIAISSMTLGLFAGSIGLGPISIASYAVGAAVGFYLAVVWVVRAIRHGEFGSDVLAVISIAATALTAEWLAASVISVMLATGRGLENWAEGRARMQLEALLARAPQVAHRIGENLQIDDIPLSDVAIGDRLLVRSGEVVPIDGTLETEGTFDESALTGEPIPQEWVENLKRAETFNQGQETTAYLAASILDLAWHEVEEGTEIASVEQFEADAIEAYGLAFAPTPTRYRSTYFSHIFAGGYSAGYYGYIWSEVLDADTVDWMKSNGGLTRSNGDRFRNELLSRGGSVDSMQLFRNFRGQDASIEPLLKRRGLN